MLTLVTRVKLISYIMCTVHYSKNPLFPMVSEECFESITGYSLQLLGFCRVKGKNVVEVLGPYSISTYWVQSIMWCIGIAVPIALLEYRVQVKAERDCRV